MHHQPSVPLVHPFSCAQVSSVVPGHVVRGKGWDCHLLYQDFLCFSIRPIVPFDNLGDSLLVSMAVNDCYLICLVFEPPL